MVGVNLSTNLKVKLGFGPEDVSIDILMKGRGKKTLNKKHTEVADFIQYRLEKRPRMIGLIMKMDGFTSRPSREELLAYSESLALVKITPTG